MSNYIIDTGIDSIYIQTEKAISFQMTNGYHLAKPVNELLWLPKSQIKVYELGDHAPGRLHILVPYWLLDNNLDGRRIMGASVYDPHEGDLEQLKEFKEIKL